MTDANTITGAGKNSLAVLLPAFMLGLTAVIAQLTLFREFALLFSTNEIIYAVLLSIWLLFTGLGSWVAGVKYDINKQKYHTILTLLFAVSVYTAWLTVPFFKNLVVPAGEVASPAEVMISASLILFPVCFFSGCVFVIYASSSRNLSHVSYVYRADTFGALAGSVLFYISVFFGSSPDSVIIYSLLSYLILVIIVQLIGKKLNMALLIPSIVVIVLIALSSLLFYGWSIEKLLPGQKIIESTYGHEGRYIITENNGQHNLYSSASFVLSSDNILPSEEFVHVAMLQYNDPGKVLVVNNYSEFTEREMSKYINADVTYIEQDPVKVDLIQRTFGSAGKYNSTIVYSDLRTFIDTISGEFDLILIKAGGVTSVQDNRYFTERLLNRLKTALKTDGILQISWQSSSEYYGGGFADICEIIRSTAASVFRNVKLVPLSEVYLIARNKGDINLRVGEAAIEKNIICEYINPYFIDDNLTEDRAKSLEKKTAASGLKNTEEDPVLYINGMQYWLSQFRPYYFFIPLLVIIIGVIFIAFRSRPVGLNMFIAGFSVSGITTILLVVFAYLSGSMFRDLSLFYAVSMAGILAGTIIMKQRKRTEQIRLMVVPFSLLAVVTFMLSVSQTFIFNSNVITGKTIVLILVFIAGACSGNLFSVLTLKGKGENNTISSVLYSHDMWGSFAGGLFCSLVLIPYLSMIYTGFVISFLLLTTILINFIFRK